MIVPDGLYSLDADLDRSVLFTGGQDRALGGVAEVDRATAALVFAAPVAVSYKA